MIRMKFRYFVLPLLAVVVIIWLPRTADSGRGAPGSGCGAAVSNVTDPKLRAAFANFDRAQSVPAAKVCALYRNSVP